MLAWVSEVRPAVTASETNGGGLITRSEDHRKLIFNHPDVQPRVVVLDPVLTVGLPAQATAACGMDVLTHSIEAYTSNASNSYADGLALHAIRLTGHVTQPASGPHHAPQKNAQYRSEGPKTG